MKLTKLSYKDPNWELLNLELDDLNLIVGKNSTGKSKTLFTIDLLVKLITQKRDLNWGGLWNLEFKNHTNNTIVFEFATSYKEGGIVTAEKIAIDGVQVLFRYKDGSVVLRNKLSNDNDTTYPPANKLAVHTNRDIKKYPYLEEIINWAEQSYGFQFGNISPNTQLSEQSYELLTTIEDIPTLYNSLSESDKQDVLDSFNKVGYQISSIRVDQRGEFVIIYVKEESIQKAIPHHKLSQGMFRALAIVIFLEYLNSRKRPSTIIIDDLCEGLDYERATKLGKLIFEQCKENDIQLIVTSNDVFLMDVVDIKHWNILQRKGRIVSGLNNKNSKDLFQKFRFTGLSNFDLFASDFINQQIND